MGIAWHFLLGSRQVKSERIHLVVQAVPANPKDQRKAFSHTFGKRAWNRFWEVPKGTCPRCALDFFSRISFHNFLIVARISEDAKGGWKKERGRKTSRMTPLPKRGFGPPLVRYVFHAPQVSVLCFSRTKIHDRADQKLFWRGPKIFGRARSLVRFPPPIRFAPPHITAQLFPNYRSERLPR